MEREVGVGVIGMGWMGDVHSRSYRAVGDRFHANGIGARLIACADVDRDRAEAAARRFGYARVADDWQAVIDDPEVEAVSVTTPNDLHLPIVRAAAAAGKHVLCEKPVGRSPDETIAAAAAAARADIISLVGYNYRWAPVVQHAHDLIRAGELGEITHYRGRFLNGYARDPNGVLTWRFQAEHGLGAMPDLLSHVIDMAHFLCGSIDQVVANSHTFITRRPLPGDGATRDQARSGVPMGEVTNEDYVAALVRFAGGAQGSLEACRVITGAACDMAFEIHGTKGAVTWTMERMNELRLLRRGAGGTGEEGYTTELSGPAHPFHRSFNPAWGLNLGYDDLKVIEASQFLQAVASGSPATPDLQDAAAVARVQQAISDSWGSGRWETVAGAD